jgi:hypothetical protein
VLVGSRSEHSVVRRQELACRSEADIVQVVAASADVLEAVVQAVLAVHMVVASIAGWAMGRMQIQAQYHFAGSEALYRRTAADVAVGGPAVAAAGGDSSGPAPAEIDDATGTLRVTGGFRCLQNAVWLWVP